MSRRSFAKGGVAALATACLSSLPLALLGCQDDRLTREVVDMGGRVVKVPEEISRVFCTNPIGTYNMFFLDPRLLAGWNFAPSGMSRDYIDDELLDLPALGVWMGAGTTPNAEEIAMQAPDVLLCYWTADEAGVRMANDIQEETGMPVVLLNYDVRSLPESYRFLGDLIGGQAAVDAEALAVFCEEKLALVRMYVERVAPQERKSIFLAQGTGGLSTDPVGSMHVTDALELIETANVADMPGTEGQGMGMPSVNVEQVMTWDPDAVLVSEYNMADYQRSNVYVELLTDSNWRQVPCVSAGQVYRIPQLPFTWFGRPPSALRLLGCLWLVKILYPQCSEELDVRAEAREFAKLFFGKDLSDEDLGIMLDGSGVS